MNGIKNHEASLINHNVPKFSSKDDLKKAYKNHDLSMLPIIGLGSTKMSYNTPTNNF